MKLELPDLGVFFIAATLLALGYFFPITVDPRVGYALGFLAGVVAVVVIEIRWLGRP